MLGAVQAARKLGAGRAKGLALLSVARADELCDIRPFRYHSRSTLLRGFPQEKSAQLGTKLCKPEGGI